MLDAEPGKPNIGNEKDKAKHIAYTLDSGANGNTISYPRHEAVATALYLLYLFLE